MIIPKKIKKDWMSNRDVVKRPVRFSIWCTNCDRTLVSENEKCPVCGTRHKSTNKGRLKK